MMKCKKCGTTLLHEQVPEVHISEAQVQCVNPECDGMATYVNNGATNFSSDVITGSTETNTSSILMEDDSGAHHG